METIFHMNEKLEIKISGDTHHFLLNTLKGTKITSPVVILYYSTLSGTNRQILIPKRYDSTPIISIGESPREFDKMLVALLHTTNTTVVKKEVN